MALLKNVLTTHEKGRPILIGTTSVEKSEELAAALKDLGTVFINLFIELFYLFYFC
jgi:preprotein translocase subunit SecA